MLILPTVRSHKFAEGPPPARSVWRCGGDWCAEVGLFPVIAYRIYCGHLEGQEETDDRVRMVILHLRGHIAPNGGNW